MITIVDYGAGNLQSVCNTLERTGAPFTLTRDPAAVAAALAATEKKTESE